MEKVFHIMGHTLGHAEPPLWCVTGLGEFDCLMEMEKMYRYGHGGV